MDASYPRSVDISLVRYRARKLGVKLQDIKRRHIQMSFAVNPWDAFIYPVRL